MAAASHLIAAGKERAVKRHLAGLAILLVGGGVLSGGLSEAASPDYCQQYATSALAQFQSAKSMGIPGLNFPVWSDNYQHHYQWCLTVSEAEAGLGSDFRDVQIARFSNGNGGAVNEPPASQPKPSAPPANAPPASPPPKTAVIGQVLPIKKGNSQDSTSSAMVNIVKASQEGCKEYAQNAAALTKQYVQGKCDMKGYRWNKSFDAHQQWCLQNISQMDSALKSQQKDYERCDEPYTMIIPGLMLGLRHLKGYGDGGNQADDPYVYPVSLYEKGIKYTQWCDYDDVLGEDMTLGKYMFKCKAIAHHAHAKPLSDVDLPPGVVFRFTAGVFGEEDEKELPKAAGCDWPEYMFNGKFKKMKVKQYGWTQGANADVCWYESTGQGFNNWPKVNQLPRGTMVGLKHSIRQSKKTVVWQGVVLDPADKSIPPPPGFTRKFGGDMGAPSGHGFYWYEKVTGK